MPDSEYLQSVQAWRLAQDADIRRPRGLLALSGLLWLQKGTNTIGSSRDCTICLPKPVPRLLGAFDFDGARVTFSVDIGQVVDIDGAAVQSVSLLRFEDENGASLLRSGDLEMALTRHAGRVGLRVWNAARAREFPPRSWFDVDERYLIRAAYTAYPVPVQIRMPDAGGEIQRGYVQGYVSFKLAGKSYNLEATETDDGRLFLQLRDRTNGIQTYPEGRYMHTEAVSEDGKVVVDFNKACNPPSAFTQFTTCTFAPKESALNCEIEAGEHFVGAPPAGR